MDGSNFPPIQQVIEVIDTGLSFAILITVVRILYQNEQSVTREYIDFLKSRSNGSDKPGISKN